MNTSIAGVIASFALCSAASAATVDLSTWSQDGRGGDWTVASDGSSVTLLDDDNSESVFHNNGSSIQNKRFSTTFKVNTAEDDDFVGFVLGYKSGDNKNRSADYLLVDWKQKTQTSAIFGEAPAGLAISRITGTLMYGEGWAHDGYATELARGTTLGSTGWKDNVTYDVDLTFQSDLVEVFVNGTKEISLAGSFSDGGFGFYNLSQPDVTYAATSIESIAPVPLPASLPLLLAGLGGVALMRRKRRS